MVLRALHGALLNRLTPLVLKVLTFKIVRLLTLAPGRRSSELHALEVGDSPVYKLSKPRLFLERTRFLANNQATGSIAAPFFHLGAEQFYWLRPTGSGTLPSPGFALVFIPNKSHEGRETASFPSLSLS